MNNPIPCDEALERLNLAQQSYDRIYRVMEQHNITMDTNPLLFIALIEATDPLWRAINKRLSGEVDWPRKT